MKQTWTTYMNLMQRNLLASSKLECLIPNFNHFTSHLFVTQYKMDTYVRHGKRVKAKIVMQISLK